MDVAEHLLGRRPARLALALRKIVVVIPVHGEADRLPACLASIAAAADAVEVPVTVLAMLDACTDHSEAVVGARVRALRVSLRNVGAARAAGFAAASVADPTIWFASTDADGVVPRRWLADRGEHLIQFVRLIVWRRAIILCRWRGDADQCGIRRRAL